MGVGETASIDEKGRIIIPAEIRKTIGKRTFNVEIADKDTIILKAVESSGDLVKKIEKIRLTGEKEKASIDFSTVKDKYGGKRVEDT
jgi:bifunctional DNA-binding transcriptional regulator/antitoxin component of YhaV-PrlF toxin-antitoxin module